MARNRNLNHERAGRANLALHYHSELIGDTDGEPETMLVDLLTDLMHSAAVDRIDFQQVLQTARTHYEEEAL